jgi:transcription initiation factor TFIIIB Brf1 subunit/transcription initiation factor TFIIB
MIAPSCPICAGPTHEIRAKLVCRQCGMILETCCEGGPMAGRCDTSHDGGNAPAAPPSRPESSDDFSDG